MLNSTARTERRIERSRIACDFNNVQDLIDLMRKIMEKTSEAMMETKDGSVEDVLATIGEELNTTHGKLIKLRGRLEGM